MIRRLIACGLLLGWAGGLAAEPVELPPEYRELARRLSADDFAARQSAEHQLAAAPHADVLPWLTELARTGDAECAARAVRVLERWMMTAPAPLSDQAETQIAALQGADSGSLHHAARDALSVHQELRQERAVEKLRSLGAKVDMGPDKAKLYEEYNVGHARIDWVHREALVSSLLRPAIHDAELDAPPVDEQGEAIAPRNDLPSRPMQVFLTSHWKGGIEGVRHLERLVAPEHGLAVYLVKGCGVSREEVQSATAELDRVLTQERGPSLGVSQRQGGDNCYISQVVKGSAADQAGVQEGDVIVDLGGVSIGSFSQLITQVREKHELGETVPLTIVRNGRVIKKSVTFGDWADVDTESELWNPDSELMLPTPFPFRVPAR